MIKKSNMLGKAPCRRHATRHPSPNGLFFLHGHVYVGAFHVMYGRDVFHEWKT